MAQLATTEQVAAWRRVISDRERGEETQGDFCVRRGPKLATFRNWKYRLARGERKREVARIEALVGFVPVRLVDRVADGGSGIELDLAWRVVLSEAVLIRWSNFSWVS